MVYIVIIGSSGWLINPASERLRKLSVNISTIVSPDPDIRYIIIAEQKNIGARYKWFRDKLANTESYEDLDALAAKLSVGSNRLIFTPWLSGESCPVSKSWLRGGFINLSIENIRADMIRAVLEGVSYNVRWALEGVEELLRRNKGKVD
ncbi:MAG: FGGY-family carbohydrate kinase [Promethearchaeota archaeon]